MPKQQRKVLLTTAGDFERAAYIGETLPVILLAEDERVNGVYCAWLESRDPRLVTVLVRDVLGLSYPVLPSLMTKMFAVATLGGDGLTGPDRPLRFGVNRAALTHAGIHGRASKKQGEHLFQWVEWFYRAKVKDPRESVRSLGAAYDRDRRQSGVSRSQKSDGRSVVEYAIREVDRLLSSLDAIPLPK